MNSKVEDNDEFYAGSEYDYKDDVQGVIESVLHQGGDDRDDGSDQDYEDDYDNAS